MPPKKTKQTTLKPPDSHHPPPFSKAPTSLSSFLDQLDPAQVYITHIDRTQVHVKQQVFFFAFLLNASIAALLVWRAYVAIPKYFALTQTFLGYDSSAKVGEVTPTNEKVWILFSRTATMLFDYLLVRLVVPWPGSFFFERPANPVTWRWNIGFQKEEVVVRVCRNWEGRDMMKGEKKGEESPFFKTRILTAVDMEVMEKTGYLMMDGSWDLDFGAMQDAHTLVKMGKLGVGELDALVLVHQDAGGYKGWLGWRFRQPKGETAEEERRRKLMAFKELLASKGKESLFWKWQEVVEDERSADGTFTPEAQEKVSKRVFAKEGIDFKEAMESVGQVEALPVGPR
jgi:hypothetical protein